MKNAKKGFTLVELLVVIAILAILATVSVAGYSAYIQRAYASEDGEIVSQLNTLLYRYTSKESNDDVTVDNVLQVTQNILKEAGYEDLVPKSKNHFYYDLQEHKYVLLSDEEALADGFSLSKAISFFLRASAADEFPSRPGNFFTEGKRYFLVDTAGDIADIIKGFYSFDHFDGDTVLDRFAAFVETAKSNPIFASLVDKAVFVTSEGNLVVDVASEHTMIFMHSDAVAISNIITDGRSTKPVDYLIKAVDDVNIIVPQSVKVSSHGLYIDNPNGKNVTVILKGDSWNDVRDDVDAGFTNSSTTVVLSGVRYEIDENFVYLKGDRASGVQTELKYNNPMQSFNVVLNADGTTNKVYNNTANVGYIALDKGDFTLGIDLDSVVGVKNDGSPVSNYDLVWSVHPASTSYLDYVDGKFVFKPAAAGTDVVQVVANARINNNGYADNSAPSAEQVFTLKVVRITGATLSVDDKTTDTGATVVHDGPKSYDVKLVGTPAYNPHKIAEIECDATLSLTYTPTSGAAVKTANGVSGTITTAGEAVGKLNVAIGNYVSYNLDLTVFDITNLPLSVKSDNLVYVGSGNAIKVSDLFAGTVPANAELRVYGGVYNDDNFTDLSGRRFVRKIGDAGVGASDFSVKENVIPLASGTTMGETIEFNKNTTSAEVCFTVVVDGIRISPDVNVRVVAANNVRSFSELVAGESNVLMNNISMESSHGQYIVANGKTIYGNFFTIDLKNATKKGLTYGYLRLSSNATLRDVRVIGDPFPKTAMSGDDEYGINAVWAEAGSTVDNCYIANTRSPLMTGTFNVDGTVTVRDTVLYGGAYANIDHRGGTLKIEGNVTTVQQLIDIGGGKHALGLGIAVWFTDCSKTIVIDPNADFRQYNFLTPAYASKLPSVSASGIELMNLSDMFNKLFTAEYDDNHFASEGGDEYIHCGIVAIDKYMFNYTIECQKKSDGCGGIGAGYAKDTPVKLTITPTKTVNNATVTILYDKDGYYESNNGNQKDGVITWTGNLVKGTPIVIEGLKTAKAAFNVFDFGVTCEDMITLDVNGINANGKNMYESAFYVMDLSDKLNLGASVDALVQALKGQGLHYKYMQADIYTYNNEDTLNKQRLEEYIAMGNYYSSGAGSVFVNGELKPYGSTN